MKKYFFLFTIIVSAFYSCKKETPHTDPRVIDVDVFVSGYVSDYGDSYYDVGYPTYWKNGSPVVLGDVSKKSEAYSIFLVKK